MVSPTTSLLLDIELPFKTRGSDQLHLVQKPALAPAACARMPFLIDLLLFAGKPFGLEVEVKSEERVVGCWFIEVNPRDVGGAYVSQAKANLYVCASGRGDARATGAFLVIRQWWVAVSDKGQLAQLYAALSYAAIERLEALVASVHRDSRELRLDGRACVLFLLDGRRLDRKLFSLARLQTQLLEDLDCQQGIPGLELSVAHGRGTGTQPTLSLTQPALFDAPDSKSFSRDVFVPEKVSVANQRWNRRSADRTSAMLGHANVNPHKAAGFEPARPLSRRAAASFRGEAALPELTSTY